MPLFAQKRLFPMGDTFHFWGIPGSRPRSQYIFLVHNHQLWISISLIPYTFCTTISTKIPTSSNNHNLSPINSIYPFPCSYLGILSPDQNIQKIYLYTLSYIYLQITHLSITFPSKMPKNGLKSLFFNR